MGSVAERVHYADDSYENCMLQGEGSAAFNSVFMFCFTLAELQCQREAPFAVSPDGARCNWLAKVIDPGRG